MKLRLSKLVPKQPGLDEQASSRSLSLVLGCFLLGIAVSAAWFYYSARHTGAGPSPETGTLELSEATRSVLKRLPGPVEIKYYSLLDPATTSDSLRAFADRVERLLRAYQQESDGRIKVTRYGSLGDDSQAASADGMRVFNLSQGEACYLGIRLNENGQKQILPELSPEWEPALESDLSRALQRLGAAATPPVAGPRPQVGTSAIQAVKQAFPDLASVSLEEGRKRLREAGLKQAQAAAAQLENRIQEAQQRVLQLQNGGSAADQEAALRQLRQLQDQQIQLLKENASRVEAQVAAFEQLKSQAP